MACIKPDWAIEIYEVCGCLIAVANAWKVIFYTEGIGLIPLSELFHILFYGILIIFEFIRFQEFWIHYSCVVKPIVIIHGITQYLAVVCRIVFDGFLGHKKTMEQCDVTSKRLHDRCRIIKSCKDGIKIVVGEINKIIRKYGSVDRKPDIKFLNFVIQVLGNRVV